MRLQVLLRQAGYGSDQRVGELTADGRSRLRHVLDGGEPVEARQQRGVQRRGDGERTATGRAVRSGRRHPRAARFPAPSLSAPRRTSGTPSVWAMILVQHLWRQRFALGDAQNERLAFVPPETVECQRRDMCVPWPRRGKLRSCSDDQQDRQIGDALNGRARKTPVRLGQSNGRPPRS